MLLSNVLVTNSRGSVLDLPLEDISNGYKVEEIEGLGPVKATLVSSSFAGQDGSQHHSARRENRNIVIKLGLEPDWTVMSVQDLRQQLYEFFMPKTAIALRFSCFNKFALSVLDQNFDVDIEGRIETCEPAIFTGQPGMEISIICNEPDFVVPTLGTFEALTTSAQVESELLYPGNIETGVLFTLYPDRAVNEFTIYQRTPDERLLSIDFSYPLIAGDELKISSVKGDKFAFVKRAGVESSVVWAIDPTSPWLELYSGMNNLRVYAVGDSIPWELEYTKRYGGL